MLASPNATQRLGKQCVNYVELTPHSADSADTWHDDRLG